MKRKTFILLGSTIFLLCSCSPSSFEKGKMEEGTSYEIVVKKDDAVTLNVDSNATAGSRVDFTISYDEEVYALTSISVNEEMPVKYDSTHYSFKMPNKEAEIVVSGYYIDPSYGKHSLTNLNADKGVVLDGLPNYTKAGESVSFSVRFAYDSSYSFTGEVTIEDENENLVDFTLNNGVYTFTMPDSDVTIDTSLEEDVHKIYISSKSQKNLSGYYNPYFSSDGGVTYSSRSSDSSVSDGKLFYAKKGEWVRAQLSDSDYILASGLTIKDSLGGTTSIEKDDDNYVYFEMPGADIELIPYGETNYVTIAVENAPHFSATLNYKVDDELVEVTDLTKFETDDVVYIKITASEDVTDDYQFSSVSVTYGNGSSALSLTTDNAGELYHFTVRNYQNITVKVVEKNVSLFKGYPFTGATYYGANLYGATKATSSSLSSSYTTIVEGDGSMKRGTDSYNLVSATSKTGDGLATLDNGYDFSYGEAFIFGHYQLKKSISASYDNDYLVAIRSQDTSDTYSNYKFYYQIPSDKSFIAVMAYRVVDSLETYVSSMFFDADGQKFYDTDLTFEFTSGESFTDSSAVYNVKVGETLIGTVNALSYSRVEKIYREVTLNYSDNYTFKLQTLNSDEEYEDLDNNAAPIGETVYIRIIANEDKDEDIEISKVNVTYNGSSTLSVTTIIDQELYSFAMNNASDVTISLTEFNPNAYKDYPFVGNFYGANLYSANSFTTASTSSSYSLSITADGTLKKNGSTVSTITSATNKNGDGDATLASGYDFSYGESFVFAHYSFTKTKDNAYGSDWIVAFKYDEGTSSSDYKFHYAIPSNKPFIAVNVYKGDELYASMFFDAVNKEFYDTGLEFVFKTGDDVNSSSAVYDVKVNDTVIGTVDAGTYTKADA